MEQITNRAGLPAPIVDAIIYRSQDPERWEKFESLWGAHSKLDRYSVSRLLRPPLQYRLQKDNDYEVDVADSYWALFGGLIHTVLELAAKRNGHKVEQLVHSTVDNALIYGVIDHLTLDEIDREIPLLTSITDYKVTSTWEAILGMRDERIEQLNMLAYLARQAPGTRWFVSPSFRLSITYLFRDWSATEAGRRENYPQKPVIEIPVPQWDDEQCFAFIRKRLNDQRDADAGNPRPCTDSERWLRPGQWAVYSMTKDRKKWKEKADRVTDTKEQALDWLVWKNRIAAADAELPEHIRLEERPGSYRRCEPKPDGSSAYCPVAHLCPLMQEIT